MKPRENDGTFVDPTDISELLTKRYAPLLQEPTKIELNPSLWRFAPTGARIVVAVDPTPEVYLGILTATERNEQVGIGIVIAVGPQAHESPPQYPGGVEADSPAELLYREVIFGAHVGKPLRLDFIRDSHYKADLLVMTSRDIWCISWDKL